MSCTRSQLSIPAPGGEGERWRQQAQLEGAEGALDVAVDVRVRTESFILALANASGA